MAKRRLVARLLVVASTVLLAVLCAANPIPAGAQDEPSAAQEEERSFGTEGEPVVVAIKEAEPFVFLDGEEEPTGYSIELWESLAEAAGLEYRYEVVATVEEQLDAVESGEADAAIAAISVTGEREERVDFTHPIYVGGQQVLVAAGANFAPESAFEHIVGSGILAMFGGLIGVTIVMGVVLWLLERRKNPHFGQDGVWGALDGIWWSVVTLTTVGYGDKVPQSRIGRILSMVWILAGVVFLALFTATVTTSLTVEELGGSIRSVEDLYGQEVVTVEGTTSETTLRELHIAYDTVADLEAGARLVESGGADALVYDAPLIQYYAATAGRGMVETVGEVFHDELYAIALPQDSALREPLNVALVEAADEGETADLVDRWFRDGG